MSRRGIGAPVKRASLRFVGIGASLTHLSLYGLGYAVGNIFRIDMFIPNVVNWLLLPGFVVGEALEGPLGLDCWNCTPGLEKTFLIVVLFGTSNLAFVLLAVAAVTLGRIVRRRRETGAWAA